MSEKERELAVGSKLSNLSGIGNRSRQMSFTRRGIILS